MYSEEKQKRKIYHFLILSPEDEQFLREMEIPADLNLMDFHNALKKELEYDEAYMASFFTTSDNWIKEEEYTLIPMDREDDYAVKTMEEGLLSFIISHEKQKLIYVFDYFTDRCLFLEYTGSTEAIEGKDYPACNRSQGFPPPLYGFLDEKEQSLNDDNSEPYFEDDET